MSNAEFALAGWTFFRNHIYQTRIAKRMEALSDTGPLVTVNGILMEAEGATILPI